MAAYRTRNVWLIASSAFFADLGYQAVLAGFPLFLVLTLHAPVWEYGLASALSYGGGAIFSFVGGVVGDRVGHKKLALIGNSIIPLLSLSALVYNPVWAIGLLAGGWWARNLRSPSRRAMLVEAVPKTDQRAKAFGFLHALDVGGGVLAAIYDLVALTNHLPFRWIFLATTVPLVVSTLALAQAKVGYSPAPIGSNESTKLDAAPPERTVRTLLVATGLYGFTFYSVGYPVLTLAQDSKKLVVGLAAFLLLQGVSALTGLILGGRLGRDTASRLVSLGVLGYLAAGVGAGVVALGYSYKTPLVIPFLGIAIIGFALGIVETFEPTVMSVLRIGSKTGSGFGALSAARSLGTFGANLIMGILYSVAVGFAYGYVAILAVAAAAIILSAVPSMRRWQSSHPS